MRFYDPDCSEKQKKCTFNHHCHPNVAFLAQVFMRDSMGSGKSPTKEETQRISFLLAEGFKVSEIHRRMSKFSLKAMRRWCQKLKAGLPLRKKPVRDRRVELPIAKEVADGLAGQKALSSGTLGTNLGVSRTTAWRLLREQHGRPYKRLPVQSLTEQQKATDVLLSISGGSWHQSLCSMVLYKPILHVLEGWGETKIGGLPN